MTTYLVLIRGINVGGKNKVSMTTLRECLEAASHQSVRTYINSGNVILESENSAQQLKHEIEDLLPKTFKLDTEMIKVLVITRDQLQAIVDQRPKGFGDHPDMYHSDVIFLIDIQDTQAIKVFDPREGVDRIWSGDGVIYSERLSAERTKSRLSKIVGTTSYKSMTIRTWNTTTKLLSMMRGEGK